MFIEISKSKRIHSKAVKLYLKLSIPVFLTQKGFKLTFESGAFNIKVKSACDMRFEAGFSAFNVIANMRRGGHLHISSRRKLFNVSVSEVSWLKAEV